MVNENLLIDDIDEDDLDLSLNELEQNNEYDKSFNNDYSSDNLDDDFCDIITEGNIIPDIKIEVKKDENNEKIVKFTLNLIINEQNNEIINIDLKITKKTYLMIAEELFK